MIEFDGKTISGLGPNDVPPPSGGGYASTHDTVQVGRAEFLYTLQNKNAKFDIHPIGLNWYHVEFHVDFKFVGECAALYDPDAHTLTVDEPFMLPWDRHVNQLTE